MGETSALRDVVDAADDDDRLDGRGGRGGGRRSFSPFSKFVFCDDVGVDGSNDVFATFSKLKMMSKSFSISVLLTFSKTGLDLSISCFTFSK